MTRKSTILLAVVAFLATQACNGKKNGGTTPGGGTNDTGEGPGGGLVGGAYKPRPKKLSKKAKKAFKKAQENVKAILDEAKNRGGKWRMSDCRKVARIFAKVAEDTAGEKRAVAQARFNEGVAWSRCGEDERARTSYNAALAANPKYASAKVNLAEMDSRGGNPDAAYGAFLQAFLAQPGNLDANYNLAVIFQQKARKGARAPEVLRRFWSKISRRFNPRTAYEVAELHLRMVLSKSSAGKTIRSATLNLKAYTLLAMLYFDRSKQRKHRSKLMLARLVLKEASKALKKPIVKGNYCKKPEAPTAFDMAAAQMRNIAGLILLRRKRLVEAMYQFEGAIKCNADFPEAHMNRAAIALGFRGYWIAYDSFKRVIKLQPKNVEAVIGLGVAYRGLASAPPAPGRPRKPPQHWYDKAVAQYKKALSMNPNATDAIYNLAHLYMDYINDTSKAETWFRKYLAKPRSTTARAGRKYCKDQLAEIAYQRKMFKKMQDMKSKNAERMRRMEELRKRRAAEEAARRAAAMRPRPMGARPKGGMK